MLIIITMITKRIWNVKLKNRLKLKENTIKRENKQRSRNFPSSIIHSFKNGDKDVTLIIGDTKNGC